MKYLPYLVFAAVIAGIVFFLDKGYAALGAL